MAGYRDIGIYQRAYKAAISCYRMSESFPNYERYSLTDQIRRASISIALNIAEGYARRRSQNTKDFWRWQ